MSKHNKKKVPKSEMIRVEMNSQCKNPFSSHEIYMQGKQYMVTQRAFEYLSNGFYARQIRI